MAVKTKPIPKRPPVATPRKDNPVNREYEERAKNLIKAEMKRRGLTYAGLADSLAAIGLEESERNIANKLARGGFTAAFLLQCLDAMGSKMVQISD